MQRDNLILWLPVFFGFGIWIYFQLLNEPSIWLGALILIIILMLLFLIKYRSQSIDKYIFIYLIFIGFGFVVAQFKTNIVASPIIENSKSIKEITARVMRIEQRPQGPRVWFDNIHIENLQSSKTPNHIRVTFPRAVELNIADEIKFRAKLRPPPAPSVAGSYDFQRRAWFVGLGGVGFSIGPPEILYSGDDASQSAYLHLTEMRKKIGDIITATLPDKIAAITSALIIGDRSAIDKNTQQTMRDAGLAHLLAISGLHMGLVASVLFFTIRAGLALSEYLALQYPIKKWAAWGALPGSLAYLLIAGAPLPTQRAFIMTALVLLAIICDRVALSMRLVAFAALGVLFLFPESLFSPSFQMSFAAVTGLIALFDSPLSRRIKTQLNATLLTKIIGYILALSASTLVATLATMPFAIYHFGRIADYGLIANLLAVPIMAFWVMPWAVVSMLLMPIGLGFIGLIPMGWGVQVILDVATKVASWPGSYQLIANIPDIALALFIITGLWLCLWQAKLRLLLLPLVPVAVIFAYFDPKPNIFVSASGKLIAIHHQTGQLSLSNTRKNRFEADSWQQLLGSDMLYGWPDDGVGKMRDITCDPLGCIYQISGEIIAFPRSQYALDEDCSFATVIISNLFPVARKYCDDPKIIIDKQDLKKKGGHLVYIDSFGKFSLKTVQETRGNRPWTGDVFD